MARVAIAGALKRLDLDTMTFFQISYLVQPSSNEPGRHNLIHFQTSLIIERMVNNQPVPIKNDNTGSGLGLKTSNSLLAKTGEAAESDEDMLPEWARGTNAATELCSD